MATPFHKLAARLIPGAIPLRRAATYGGLAGLGMYGGKKFMSHFSSSTPDPDQMGESALSTGGKAAISGVAIGGLLNMLNKLTHHR